MYCPHDVPLPLLQALEDLVDAVGEVKALQERNAEADRNAQIEVSAQVLPVHLYSRLLWFGSNRLLAPSLS